MCGIAGIVHADLPPAELDLLLRRMSGAMTHRGPDEEGHAAFADAGAGLAARRLSIVDLPNGHQPASNEDGSVHVAFNGEIYNHAELRHELQQKGHVFRSIGDTEVLVHLYEDLGADCVHRLDGMFAFAIFDRTRRRLLLARDGPGMKPLYVADTARGLLFASEIKALLASGLVEKRPDPAAIDAYLAHGFFPAPYTGFQGIEKVLPGARLLVDRDGIRRERFWRYRCRTDAVARRDEEYSGELDHLLERAVRTHLAADVPVGSLVSGGWDSSLVTALAARQTGRRLKTFSIVFPDDARRDESRYSRLLARELGTDHHEIEFHAAGFPELLKTAVRHLEEPVAAGPGVLISLVSSLASRHVKTVLTGEGADELFAGYPWVLPGRAPGRAPESKEVRHRVRRWLGARRAAWFGDRGSTRSPMETMLGRMRRLALRERDEAFLPEFRPAAPFDPPPLDVEDLASCRDPLQRNLAIEFTVRLPGRVLFHADKLTMAHSLEARVPFLDRAIVEFAERLPSAMKVRSGQRKYVLAPLARKYLPRRIARRRKQGLAYPQARLRSGPVAQALRGMLVEGSRSGGPFRREFLDTRYDEWLKPGGPLFHRPLLFVFLQAWWDEFFAR